MVGGSEGNVKVCETVQGPRSRPVDPVDIMDLIERTFVDHIFCGLDMSLGGSESSGFPLSVVKFSSFGVRATNELSNPKGFPSQTNSLY